MPTFCVPCGGPRHSLIPDARVEELCSFRSVFHLFCKYLLSASSVPGTVPGSGDSVVNKRKIQTLGELAFYKGRQEIIKSQMVIEAMEKNEAGEGRGSLRG